MLKHQLVQHQHRTIIHFIIRVIIPHIMATVNTMHKHMETVMVIINGNNNMVQLMVIMANGAVTAVADIIDKKKNKQQTKKNSPFSFFLKKID